MSRLTTKQRRSARWRNFQYYINVVLHQNDNWRYYRREGLTPGEIYRDCKGIPPRELLRHGWQKKLTTVNYLLVERWFPPEAI